MNIFMDDSRLCPYGFTEAASVEEALELVRKHDVDILSLDYNMGFRKQNGLDFVNAFCQEGLFAKEIHLHSNDMIGKHYMEERLKRAKEKGEIAASIQIKRTHGLY
ncbi:MAG: cyclic-phosphate processing receiver domain-containing protein [Ectobacillus sp.]